MEKLLKKVVSVVCAIAMVVTCITFTPATVDAGQSLPDDQWTQAGVWELYNGNDAWCSFATMEYDLTGDGTHLGDTKMTLTNSPNGDWNDVEYGLGARLPHFMANAKDTSGKALKADERYDCKITYTSSKAGKLIANIEDTEYGKIDDKTGEGYDIDLPATEDAKTVTIATFDHDAFTTSQPSTDSVTFYLGRFPTNTELTISKVEFVPNPDGWTPVPNFVPSYEGQDLEYTEVGQLGLCAMYAPNKSLYGKMKYQNDDQGKLNSVKVKVTSSSGQGNWSTSVRLKNYLKTYQLKDDPTPGLASGDKYYPTIKIKTNKKCEEDEHGDLKQIEATISKKVYKFALTEEGETVNTFTSTEPFKFYDTETTRDVKFEVGGLEPGTEFTIEGVDFAPVDASWTKVPNETNTPVGAWELFARTGTTIEEGQWGALSYKNTVTTPSKPEDTMIKVRSSSGWHDAWATLATLPNFIDGKNGRQKLTIGQAYKPVITYYSSQATKIDESGDDKTVLFCVDGQNIPFTLDACEEGETKVKELPTFTYEEQKAEKPYDVLFNLDQVEPDTVLQFANIEFVPVDDGWNSIPNRKYTKVGDTGMELYARMGESVQEASWGKTSYKYDDKTVTDDYTKVLIKTRSTSGWYVTNNPASILDFPGLAAKKMQVANKYFVRLHLQADRSQEIKDKDGTLEEVHNNLQVVVDGHENYFEELADNNEDITLETDEFVYEGNNKDLRLVLDEFTKNATLRVTGIEFVKVNEGTWTEVPNNDPTRVGKWTLTAKWDDQEELWGKMYYDLNGDGSKLGDVTMQCLSVSGWFGARSMTALYKDGAAECGAKVGENQSVYITIKSSASCYGMDENNQPNGIQVTIDNKDYIVPIYAGEFTYVIPSLVQAYSAANKSISFNLDKLPKYTELNISKVEFKDPITKYPEISALDATKEKDSEGNEYAKITWEQTADTIYGVVGNESGFKVWVDGTLYSGAALTPDYRSISVYGLSSGSHTVKVVAVQDGKETTGMTKTFNFTPETTTQAPTQPTTQGPTQATTQAPSQVTTQAPSQVTTKAPTPATTKSSGDVTTKKSSVKPVAPGKVKVKKVAKRKKSAKKIKVTLKKVAGAAGYQVGVFKKKNSKKPIVKKNTTKLKVTIKSKKIKGKKTIYVKARAYVMDGSAKLFGAWGKAKKSKAKK